MLLMSTPNTETKENCLKICSPALNRQWEATSPSSNSASHLTDLRNVTTSDLSLEVLELVVTLGQSILDLPADLDTLVDVISDSLEISLAEASAGHGWCSDTDAVRRKSGFVAWNRVLIACNVDLLQDCLNTCTVKGSVTEIKKDHVRVGPIGNKLVTELLEFNLECLSILHNLLLVLLKLRCGRLLESDSQGRNGVVVGSTLMAGKDREVDWTLKIIQGLFSSLGISLADSLAEEDHGTTRTTERLVCSRSDNICELEWTWDHTSSDETRDVSHVNDQVCTNKVCDLTHASIVDQTAVCRGTSNKNFGSIHEGILLQFFIVDDASFKVDTVWEGFEVGRDGRNPGDEVSPWLPRHSPVLQLTFSGESGNRDSNDHREADQDPSIFHEVS